MNVIVPRTCTVIPIGDVKRDLTRDSRPLSEFRDATAYVLLGDPGSGKTTAFETEREALGEEACKVDARDFLTLNVDLHPEWRNKTLFIDGLDEIRVGDSNVREPFDNLRGRLEELGRPRFRLSCREADWLGKNDWKRLTTVSPSSSVTVLRLDPLGEADIRRILSAKEGIEDPQAFIENARERRIDGLLQNPLTLELLATVLARNEQWPESRLQTFEQACSHLVREHNTEHRVAGQQVKTNQLLDAAGRLCAVQLISGIKGYMQSTGDRDSDFPSLTEIQYENPELRQSVLSTKLFKAESGSLNRFGPIHRHVAEFLGAQYLARLIEDGLSVRRTLSLITGEDGIVVTGLRGLSAWLAACSRSARTELTDRDPVGVGLYGDFSGFTLEERVALLKNLNREASRLGTIETAQAFGPLAAPDMEPALRDVLENRSRETEQQTFVDFVLRILCEGAAVPGLSDLLLDIVRDETRWPGVNVSALNAFVHSEGEEEQTTNLKTLLRDIQCGIVSDPEHELLGILLSQLYPRKLPPAEVWEHLIETGDSDLAGTYWWFWEHELLVKCSDEEAVELLDSLWRRLPILQPALESSIYLERLPLRLLARALKAQEKAVETERLYNWLSVGISDTHGARISDEAAVREIRSWLEERPQLYKKVYAEGLNRCDESDNSDFEICALKIEWRLYNGKPPPDFGVWCLKHAAVVADTKPDVALHMLQRAVMAYKNRWGSRGLSLDRLVDCTQQHPRLRERLDRLRAPQSIPDASRVEDSGGTTSRYIDGRRLQEEQWLDRLRANEAALRENRAAHGLLYHIAGIYFADSINLRIAGGTRDIENDLGSDQSLIDAVRVGIRGVIEREDVPGVEEILRLKSNGQVYHIGWPFLAALGEIGQSAPEEFSQLNEGQMRRALAFHFCSGSSHEPNWYRRIRNARPDIVAEMLVRCGLSELRSGSGAISGIFALPRNKEHAQVANLASLPFLRAFPTRCSAIQIEALDNLLWAALRHADPTSFKKLIDRKLATKSMNVAQRVRWLAAAAVIAPEVYSTALVDYVQGQEKRVRNLVGFFPYVFPRAGFSLSDVELENSVLEALVRLIGSYFRPYERRDEREDEWNASVNTDSELVHAFIQRLAASLEKDAGNALDRLLGVPTLSAWENVLSRARDSQRVIQRDASYRHPEPEQVSRTLDSGSPANAADLAALLVDRLDEISRQIETGNTDDWRQYWNEDSYGRPCKPKAENSCRDALLSDLRQRLPGNVDAQPEGQYARDKRADIRVSSGQEFQVPIEIKKNNHPDLWNAIRTQLIAKYTRDPGAEGHGVYLVFWFGSEHTPPPPSGTRPDTPVELRERLEATLSDEEARRISVCVIDVSGEWPEWQED